MKFLDLFAGIGGFRLGMESAGHECIGFCEIDKFARTSYKAIHDTTGEVEMLKDQTTDFSKLSPVLKYKKGYVAKMENLLTR